MLHCPCPLFTDPTKAEVIPSDDRLIMKLTQETYLSYDLWRTAESR